jgi:hypothetical protein
MGAEDLVEAELWRQEWSTNMKTDLQFNRYEYNYKLYKAI